jgi:hypothetical protein
MCLRANRIMVSGTGSHDDRFPLEPTDRKSVDAKPATGSRT